MAVRNYERLDKFISGLAGDIYPEPISEPHLSITRRMIPSLIENKFLAPGHKVLDVGCGKGIALEMFRQNGISAVGVTLGDDLKVCQDKDLEVYEMDQSFLTFPDGEFDFVWCRHALEHSVFPLFTLAGFHRVLKTDGLLYVEVPAPDTACHHEQNQNHYSVLGKAMWWNLFRRANFAGVSASDIRFTVPAGPDVYWMFLLRKAGPPE